MNAPPCRPRRRRPAKYTTAKPPADTAAKRWVALSLVVMAGLIAFVIWSSEEQPDPHYVKGLQLVDDYEVGKTDEARNYTHPAYAQALEELRLVDAGSISAAPAKELAEDIELRMRRFSERLAALAKDRARKKELNRKRNYDNLQARTRSRLSPQTEYPECEHEEKGQAHQDGS